MVVQQKLYSAADLWELSNSLEYRDRRLELSEGVLIVMSPSGGKHGKYASRALIRIGIFVEEHDLGETTAAETGYILHTDSDGKDTLVGFVAKARIPAEGLPDGFIPFAPDLVLEVVSPNDSANEVQDKVLEYLRYGTRMVLVAYPKSRTLTVHKSAGTKVLGVDDIFDGGDVLPGFSVRVGEIFGA
jgi:Uma2 family endonuclease